MELLRWLFIIATSVIAFGLKWLIGVLVLDEARHLVFGHPRVISRIVLQIASVLPSSIYNCLLTDVSLQQWTLSRWW